MNTYVFTSDVKKEDTAPAQATHIWSIRHSIKERVRSLLGFFKKSTPEEPGISGSWKNWNEPPRGRPSWVEAPNGHSSKIGKILTTTSFYIGGILSWLVISQISTDASDLTSRTLHSVWMVQPTSHDKQQFLIAQNGSLQTSIVSAQDTITTIEKKKTELTNAKNQLTTENTTLKATNKTLAKKLAGKKTYHRPSGDVQKKKIAETRQKVIDTELKKLLVLRGMKGVLKHEWIPAKVTNYGRYIQKQNRSLRIIKQKIEILQEESHSKTPSITYIPPAGERVILDRESTTSERILEQPTVSPTVPWIAPEPRKTEESVASIPKPQDSVSDDRLSTVHGDATSIPPPPTVEIVVSARDVFTVPLTQRTKTAVPETNEGAWAPKNPTASTASVGGDIPSIPERSAPKNPVAVTEIKEVWEVSVAPIPTAEESGITPENLTPEKLGLFLEQANETLYSFDGENPLKGVSLTMKRVTVRGIPAWRVFLRRGDRTGYFTLKPGQKSRNYKIVSSRSEIIKWAEKKVKKWGVS